MKTFYMSFRIFLLPKSTNLEKSIWKRRRIWVMVQSIQGWPRPMSGAKHSIQGSLTGCRNLTSAIRLDPHGLHWQGAGLGSRKSQVSALLWNMGFLTAGWNAYANVLLSNIFTNRTFVFFIRFQTVSAMAPTWPLPISIRYSAPCIPIYEQVKIE